VNTEWVRLLGDGTRITLKNHRLIARDKSGRIFQERRLLVPDNVQESILTQIEITDPASHDEYICVPRERVCQVEFFRAVAAAPTTARRAQPGAEEVSLGTAMMAGLEAAGTRVTGVIPVGAIGNSSPIATRMEYWFSRQLGLNVLSIREDPRFGSQRFELTGIVLGDPDARLFAPPEGSKIHDLRGQTEVIAPAK